MLAPALWLHISVLTTKREALAIWKILVPAGYVLACVYYIGFAFSGLIMDFDELVGPVGRFAFIFKSGPLFYLVMTVITLYFSLAFINFFQDYKEKKTFQAVLPFLVSLLFVIGWLLIIASYIFRYNHLVQETGEFIISASVILLAGVVIANRLFLEGAKTNVNREFFYSTLSVSLIVASYLVLGLLFGIEVFGLSRQVLRVIFVFLLIVSHTFYSWVTSFIRNVFYKQELLLPRVTDEEASQVLRSLNKPEILEKNILMRLRLVSKDKNKMSLDQLKEVVKESIDYFKPEEEVRTKASVKYWILKLISNQVEEGQILWDLGFEEYPLEMAEKASGQKPRLSIERPTDYQATSRNAFISLKKEAIHDLAWRISYLEKHAK